MTETKTHTEKEINDHVKDREGASFRLSESREASLSYAHNPTNGLIKEYDYSDLKFNDPSRLVCRIVNDFTMPPGFTDIEMQYNPKLSSLATFLSTFLRYNCIDLVQVAMKEYNDTMQEDPNDVKEEEQIRTIYNNLESSIKALNKIKSSLEPFKNQAYIED